MGRPRKKGNLDVPTNLYRGDGKSWRYRHPVTGKFHSMGIDRQKAFQAARKLNDLLIPEVDLVAKVSGSVAFGEFSENWFLHKRRKDGKPLSKSTKQTYRIYLTFCQNKWRDLSMDSITLLMINAHLDSLTTVPSNQTRSILMEIFDLAVSKGLCPDNPAQLTLRKFPHKERKRHTVEGLAIIRDAAEPWMKNAIDLAMLTTQRRIDIINMKWEHIVDGYLHVAQEKTTDDPEDEFEVSEGAGYVRIKIDEELQKVLDQCNDGIDSPFIIHRVPNRKGRPNIDVVKEHFTQLDKQYITKNFAKLATSTNAYPNYTSKQRPSFHEIRALAIFLHKKAGRSAQALAGHATPKMTEHYESGHEIIWNDVDIGIKLPFADLTEK
ncbi:phage integrase Arm DNA-binding domain-containing protein [Acinetobacter sp. WCHAc060025]|uniref:phage integrase Arm DNA-binding domain-containing protein n=1 Tax=Acinetobacter sp. WCHAc060025 TaxID=2518625 RepID=UPI001022C6E8|nr:phage integrase Arm DNA-binding domain-containing protein [Acinetobacter sp. WCHAc060025]RZG71846.1 integrase [Acinetobacter sp. WCHAc060025]